MRPHGCNPASPGSSPGYTEVLLFVPVASDAADLLRRGFGRKAAITRPETKENKMRAYSLSELFNLTRRELFDLHARIAAALPTLPEPEYEVALENLRRIRRVLTHPRFAPS